MLTYKKLDQQARRDTDVSLYRQISAGAAPPQHSHSSLYKLKISGIVFALIPENRSLIQTEGVF
jgi:hypothetical protein